MSQQIIKPKTNNRQIEQEYGTIPEPFRTFLMRQRQTLIMQLGALEDFLGIERSIVPRHHRRNGGETAGDSHDPDTGA